MVKKERVKIMLQIEDIYYNGIAKKCFNCVHYDRWTFTSNCKIYSEVLIKDAFIKCQYKDWMPNQKLYDRFEKNKTNPIKY